MFPIVFDLMMLETNDKTLFFIAEMYIPVALGGDQRTTAIVVYAVAVFAISIYSQGKRKTRRRRQGAGAGGKRAGWVGYAKLEIANG